SGRLQEEQTFRARRGENGVRVRRWQPWRNNKPARQDPGRPSAALRSGPRSLDAGLFQAFVKTVVLLFPVTERWLNRVAGGQTFEGERLKLFLGGLVGGQESIEIGLYSDAFSRGPFTKPRF